MAVDRLYPLKHLSFEAFTVAARQASISNRVVFDPPQRELNNNYDAYLRLMKEGRFAGFRKDGPRIILTAVD
jgi:hypothetical protein